MEIEYKSNKLEKKCSSATEIKKAFGIMAKRVASRLDDIRASPNLGILIQIPAANCHPLIGDRDGHWALDITGNFRLIFNINNNNIRLNEDGTINTHKITKLIILEISDYH